MRGFRRPGSMVWRSRGDLVTSRQGSAACALVNSLASIMGPRYRGNIGADPTHSRACAIKSLAFRQNRYRQPRSCRSSTCHSRNDGSATDISEFSITRAESRRAQGDA
jgi:hypothetical protein